MLEYSAVPVPANPEALALAIQNGVLKNETVIKSMEQFNEPIKKEEVKEAAEQEGGDIEKENLTEAHSPALDELIAYNDELVKKIMELETTVKQLRYDLYRLSAAKEKKAAEPEITADSLANTIVKTVDGVIRKAQGKLD
jgi:predicted RNase H-like nuclease (RuvC/YqgF family)